MSIFKKKQKPSPQLFSITFFLSLFGFLLGGFGLGLSLLENTASKSRDDSLVQNHFQLFVAHKNLQYCYEHDIKPCTTAAIAETQQVD